MADGDRASETNLNVNQGPEGGDEAQGGDAGTNDPNERLLQRMTEMIQNAMYQMEEFVEARLASREVVEDTPLREKRRKDTDEGASQGRSERVSFKTFKSCGATEFSGTVDPVVAHGWIDTMEKVFEISHCLETDKVIYAAAMFTDQALIWWNSKRQSMGAEQTRTMTWAAFTALFLEQYCPSDLQRNYAREFLELKQGEKTVGAYEAEFLRLSKFAAQYVISEKERVDRFVEGLRVDIREFVELQDIPSLAKAVEYARRREQTLSRRDAELMPPPKRQFRDSQSATSSFPRTSRQSELPSSQQPTQIHSHSRSQTVSQPLGPRQCFRCGKAHYGRCNDSRSAIDNFSRDESRRSSGEFSRRHEYSRMPLTCAGCGDVGHTLINCQRRIVCYECGSPGHKKRFCPRLQGKEASTRPAQSVAGSSQSVRKTDTTQTRARAFQITAEEAREAPFMDTDK